jgi:hypothetical protein
MQNKNNQGLYIDYVAKKALACDNENKIVFIENCNKCTLPGVPATKNYQTASTQATVNTKPDSYTGASNASEHIRKIQNTCVNWDSFKFGTNKQGVPFACGFV